MTFTTLSRAARALLVAILAGLHPGGPLGAAESDVTRFEAARPATILLEGRSNLAPWVCRGATVRGEVVIAASIETILAMLDTAGPASPAAIAPPRVRMEIPIASLDCGLEAMNRDMYDALEAAAHPSIVFEFRRLAGPVERDETTGRYRAAVDGELRLAGETHPVRIVVRGERIGRDQFRVTGDLPVRMSDFGITPPTGLMGLIRSRDELTVRFDFRLHPGR